MLNSDAKLNPKVLDADVEVALMRDGFGTGVVEAGEKDARVVVLCADLAESTRVEGFQKKFPDRYIEMGVAEQNMAAVASGMANYGKIPFITSYAAFSPGRNNEQIRTTIAINNVPVKICGMHAGVSVGPDGATHQALEDVGLMRMLPHMVVVSPIDRDEAEKATRAAALSGSPTYLRFSREKTPVITTTATLFEIGKAYYLWRDESPQVAIIGYGSVLHEALQAAAALKERGVRVSVVNSHTIKPLDTVTILEAASEAGRVVVVEEHQVAGGLGSAIAEFLATVHPVPIEFVAVHDRFGQSGTMPELYKEYGLDSTAIVTAVDKIVKRP